MNSVGIVGLGLIGGSLAKAIKHKTNVDTIIGWDIDKTSLNDGKHLGLVDIVANGLGEEFAFCDIIFICTPIHTVCEYVKKLGNIINENAIITDVGSTKSHICNSMKDWSSVFIGGHPMAGSEQNGFGASKHFLFENAYYILTPFEQSPKHKVENLQKFIEEIGAIPILMNPETHDKAVSAISHSPHIIAAALVNIVEKLDKNLGYMGILAAGGFKDITRIASSNPYLWQEICLSNKNEILKTLGFFKEELGLFEKNLQSDADSTLSFFEQAKNFRDNFSDYKAQGYMKEYNIKVDVEDKPGIIATVATMLSVNNINIKNIGIINSREYENGVMNIVFNNETDMEKSLGLLKSMNFSVFIK